MNARSDDYEKTRHDDQEGPEVPPRQAKQGIELHRMRWVLAASVAAIAVIFIALLISFV
ncbi:MAG: hypothetical protein RLO50_08090 [Azospirillaceae bacterium]